MNEMEMQKVQLLADKTRLDVLRMLKHIGYGHVGGSLSIVEVLAVLYGKQMHYDPKNPNWSERDMFVLSKGHSGPGLYSVLANSGFFDREELLTLNAGGTNLPSHPDRLKVVGVDMTTGSLGQGISAAAGMATGLAMRKKDQYVYAIVGDGELNEGQVWEAFQYIAHHALHNLIVFIDANKKQLDGTTDEVIKQFDIAKKMEAFGFYTQTVKGSDMEAIDQAIEKAKAYEGKALCIVLDGIKGAGVPYFETLKANHSVKFTNDEINQATDDAIAKLEAKIGGAN
ncbi:MULTISPECIES: transketolase [unclassified Breznakia]|uniref:transketolase n=1 Tax=unclassified Breznakia TaxID=2623764 RepID=UPI00247328C0|nr:MULTISPECIES: transketolase [unclassified Breznakia]MDH6367342.1 transketolase [Breznakia sp. PH1-1]MDH6404510.1 transketolase [Breznakia sp. PF1-11]MDH6412219.1 transketolase [Breznakia sp. PFB1-11]MDH6414509.1 transketolase [Breznakia sp. PFB1-14]MDH6416883.1 transketolase [Breznakia sp. PFB1-4]